MTRAADAEPRRGEARLFAADEEVGRDLAAVDWAATPLGLPGSWPQSLQTAVDILLSSRFPMWMAWGPQLTFFCNAAYRRDTLGRKYPWALGRPAGEVWEEIWDDIGPRIDIVLATGQATWDEGLLLFLERSGYPEESYHTFSYSPLRDDDGAVVGMLCVVREDTERVVGERRMATLRDLGSDPSAVLVYRRPPAPLTVRVWADDPSCLSFLRAELRRWLAAAGIGGREASDIMIAAGEATANAVEHATAGRPGDAAPVQITLTAQADHAAIRLTVSDTGNWRPPPADREEPAPGTRGHGVIFMHALMSEVTIDPAVHGTTVTLTKDLKP